MWEWIGADFQMSWNFLVFRNNQDYNLVPLYWNATQGGCWLSKVKLVVSQSIFTSFWWIWSPLFQQIIILLLRKRAWNRDSNLYKIRTPKMEGTLYQRCLPLHSVVLSYSPWKSIQKLFNSDETTNKSKKAQNSTLSNLPLKNVIYRPHHQVFF